MVCKKCGYQNSQGATFCAGCGQKLTGANHSNNGKMMIYLASAIVVIIVVLCISLFGREEEATVCSHSWKEATCAKPATCSVCQETKGVSLGHDWQPATCLTPKQCRTCGATEGAARGHQWPGDDHTKRMSCTVCGESNGVIEAPVQSLKTPSEEDLIPFGPVIAYPHPSSYLSDYETRYVKAPKGHSIYVYWNPDDASSRRKFLLYEGDEVTVLARQGSLSCVIFTDQSGEQQVGWASSDCLYYEY